MVGKVYLAVLEGVDLAGEGIIDLPLDKVSTAKQGWRMVVSKSGKPAVTRWTLLATRGGRSLVRFEPETGRTHQIRAHAAYGLNAPVAGDPVYGSARGPMLLHSRALTLAREGKRPIEAVASLPESFTQAGFGDGDL